MTDNVMEKEGTTAMASPTESPARFETTSTQIDSPFSTGSSHSSASEPSGDRDGRPGRFSGPRREPFGGRSERGGFGRRRVCTFCVDNLHYIDYKDVARLRRYLSERGKIEPRRKTGTCAKHQRWLTTALKRARQLALLPYTSNHARALGR